MTQPSTSPTTTPEPTIKDRIEVFNNIATLAYKVAAGIGATLTFWYLFTIEFFPSGLTSGEVIYFIFIAFAFGFIYVVFLVYSTVSAIWIAAILTRLLRRFPQSGATPGRSMVPTSLQGRAMLFASLLISVTFGLAAIASRSMKFIELILVALLVGIFVLILLSVENAANQTAPHNATGNGTVWLRWGSILILPLVFVCMFLGPKLFLNLAFKGLGIRAENVAIELSANEIATVARAAELLDQPIIDCRRAAADKILVHGANVLWTGIGDQSLVEFATKARPKSTLFEPESKPEKQVLVQFESKSIRILKTTPAVDRCFELPTDLLFDSAKHTLSTAAMAKLEVIAARFIQSGTVAKLHVLGHSDARPLPRNAGHEGLDNQRLSERRAEAVAAQLEKLFKIEHQRVTSDGAGSRQTRVQCPSTHASTNYEQEQCNRPNRRVEVHVTFGNPGTEKSTATADAK